MSRVRSVFSFFACIAALSSSLAVAQDVAPTAPPSAPPSADQAAPPPEPTTAPEPVVATEPAPEIAQSAPPAEDTSALVDAPPSPPPADEPAPLPWRNSLFIFDQSINSYALDQGAQLTHNPTYVWSLSFRPRWHLSDTLFVRLRQDFEWELTDSDSTTTAREFRALDTQLDLVRNKIVDVAGLTVGTRARLIFPISLESQAADRYLGVGAGVAGSYAIDGVLSGLSLDTDFAGSTWFAGSNVVLADEAYPCRVTGSDAADLCSQLGGATNVQTSFTFSVGATLNPVERLAVSLSFLWWWRRGYDLEDATVSTLTGERTLPDDSETHWRNLTWFTATVGYDVADWLTAEIYLSTLTSQLDPDGSRRNPLYNVDSTIGLTATVTADKLYGAFTGSAEEARQAEEESAQAQPAGSVAASTGSTATVW